MNQIIIRPNKNRAIITITLLTTMFLLQIVTLIRMIELTSIIKNREYILDTSIITHDRVIGIIGFITLFVYIICIVYYVLWFRRAYHNLAQFHDKLKYSNGWAAGAWFIPLFHWIGPIQMMVELYKKTIQILIQYNLTFRKNGKFLIIVFWWTLYIIAGSGSIYRMFFLKKNTYNYKTEFWNLDYYLYSQVVNVMLTFFAIWVVINYSLLENKLSQISNVIVRERHHEKSEPYKVNA